jgi:hypothetical protein
MIAIPFLFDDAGYSKARVVDGCGELPSDVGDRALARAPMTRAGASSEEGC